MLISAVALVAVGYLVGSIPTSVIIAKRLRNIDIRSVGSGNAGATNAARVLGPRWGGVVMLLDVAKGALPALASRWWLSTQLAGAPGGSIVPVVVAGATVLGHIYPLYVGFRGGKGVATGAGAFLALFPAAFAICLTGFLVAIALTGYVSLGSLVAAVLLPAAYLVVGSVGAAAAAATGDASESGVVIWLLVAVSILVIAMHRANIARLVGGTERRSERFWLAKRLRRSR